MKHLIVYIAVISIFGCIQSCISEGANAEKSIIKMGSVDDAELIIKQGEIVQFTIDDIEIRGVAVTFKKEEDGIWNGICLMNKHKIFGRQIPSGLIRRKCVDMLDVVFIHTDALKGFEVIEKIELDRKQIIVGAERPISDIALLVDAYNFGLEQRTKTQTPCTKGVFELNPVRECYFDLSKIKKY